MNNLKKLSKTFVKVTGLSLLVWTTTIQIAEALTINGVFRGSGEVINTPLGPIVMEDAPTNVTGLGNLVNIFNTAASMWEDVLLDDHLITIEYGWLNLDNFGFEPERTGIGPTWNTVFPATQAFIAINNNNQTPFFLDNTPNQNEEYTAFVSTSQNLGGGEIITGRVWRGTSGDAIDQVDVLTVMLTQLSDALGFFIPDPSFGLPGNPNFTFPSITVTDPLPFPGSVIPIINVDGGKIDLPDVVNTSDVGFGERRLLSTADVLAVAQVTGFNQVNLMPTKVPEPSAIAGLFLVCTLGTLFNKRRQN